jgi:hypothetical protein
MMSGHPSDIAELVQALQARRGRPVIFYHSALADDTVPILYECLSRIGRTEDLDLVLSTTGGSIASTRQIALLLREFTAHLSILVPYRARSAGTLLCLSADRLVLGALAELGPIDSVMGSDGPPRPELPGSISAEDIRAFRAMAEDWFGVARPEDRLQVLAMLATRIFPTSLSSFYRFDRLVREVAAELLEFGLPGPEQAAARAGIVDRLVSGYHSHDFVLTRRDIRALGLPAEDAAPAEQELLWSLSQAVAAAAPARDSHDRDQLIGIIAATGFTARHVITQTAGTVDAGGDDAGGAPSGQVEWTIADR